jgi:MFS family permease
MVAASYKTGVHFATAMLGPMLSDLGLSLADIGLLKGTAGFIAGLVGALAGGALVNVLGRGRALVLFGLLQAGAVASFAAPLVFAPTMTLLYTITIAEHFASGMATAALFTMMMDASRPASAGADYTLQASVVVLTSIAAASLSGFSADALSYTWHFALAAALCVLALVPVLWFLADPRATRLGAD